MDFSSKLLENAVFEISQLPGIGKRTALRLALHLLKQPPMQVEELAQALVLLRNNAKNVITFLMKKFVKFVQIIIEILRLYVWWKIFVM